jgi:hypothetical protein
MGTLRRQILKNTRYIFLYYTGALKFAEELILSNKIMRKKILYLSFGFEEMGTQKLKL